LHGAGNSSVPSIAVNLSLIRNFFLLRSSTMKRFWLTALALSVGLTTSAFAEVTGKVTFTGEAPVRKPLAGAATDPNCGKMHKTPLLEEMVVVGKAGELANAVVYLKGATGKAPADDVILDQQGCQYVPHVVSATVGQKLLAQNDDTFLHNVHTLPELNAPINRGQAVKGQKDPIPTKAAEFFKVKCDVHPWMSAWVAIFDHPYHSVTGEDGIFSIDTKDLKDGDYEVAVWHEKFKDCATGKVTVKAGKGTVDFKVQPKAAAAAPAVDKVVLASTVLEKHECCDAKAEPKAVAVVKVNAQK
jgi:plastocyanin